MLRFLTFRSPDAATPAAGGAAVETPPAETPKPTLASAIADAKARIAEGKSPIPDAPAETPAGETPAVETPAVETPPAETPAETPAVETPAAEPETPATTELVLPAFADGEEPLPLDIPDEAVRERLEKVIAQAEQVAQIQFRERQVVQANNEREQFEDALATDPLLVVLDHVDPEVQVDLALAILAKPGAWASIKDVVMQLENADKAEMLRSKIRERRGELQKTLGAKQAERKVMRQSERVVITGIDRISAGIPKAKREAFGIDALKTVSAYNRRTGNNRIAERDLPLIMADVLAAHGVDPLTAAALLRGEGRKPDAVRDAPPKPPVIARKTTPKEVLAANAVRNAAAQAGAPSSVVTAKVPEGLAAATAGTKKGDFKGLFTALKAKIAGI